MAIITTTLGEKIEVKETVDLLFHKVTKELFVCCTEIHYPEGTVHNPSERLVFINFQQIVSIV